MSIIQDCITAYLPPKRKVSNGWITFNAVCCTHVGESVDTKSRGHLKFDPDGSVNYGCFNCGFKFKHQVGQTVSFKFKKFLRWINVDDNEIVRISFEALREREIQIAIGVQPPPKEHVEITFEPKDLPPHALTFHELALLLDEHKTPFPSEFIDVVKYLHSRKIDTNKYDFYWSPNSLHEMYERLIIPFTWKNEIIGYSARSINPNAESKYKTEIDTGYVFNIDKQRDNWRFVIVSEGPFDAMSIDGVAVLHNEVSKKQIDVIEDLDREIIVVPHWDDPGSKLIDVAINNGWSVSFPTWSEKCKDINEAVIKYGKLFVLKDIVENIEQSKLKIRLRKMYA